MTARFSWGGYTHPDWEMNLASYTVRTRLSPRGKMLSRIYTMRLEGEIQSDSGSSGLTSRLEEVIAAYHIQNQDARFYVNGQATPHYLPNSNSISGVKMLELAHPVGDAAEYANKRTVTVVLQSEKEEPESQLVFWEETVKWIGTTGPRDEWFQGFDRPRKQRICKRTTQQIIQTGRSIGWAGYVLPPGPLLPLSEHQEQRPIELGHPRNFGQALRLYPCNWTYIHVTDLYSEVPPNFR